MKTLGCENFTAASLLFTTLSSSHHKDAVFASEAVLNTKPEARAVYM